MSDSVRPHRRQPTRLSRPWDYPGKNTGVGCHFLLQFMKVKSESKVSQSCPTLSDPMDCSLPGSSVHEIFQARVLEWGAIAFSRSANWFCHKFLERVALQGASHGRKIALLDVSLGTSEHGLVGFHTTERQNSFPRTYLKIYIWFPLTLLLKTEIHTRKDGYSLEWIRIWIITFLK